MTQSSAPQGPELRANIAVTMLVPVGTTVVNNSIVLPGGEVLRVRPVFELCDDEQGEYLDLTYDQTTARGVYYEIAHCDVDPVVVL